MLSCYLLPAQVNDATPSPKRVGNMDTLIETSQQTRMKNLWPVITISHPPLWNTQIVRSAQVEESWYVDARDKLDLLTQLPVNWDSYGAAAPSQDARAKALNVLEACRTEAYQPDALVPSADSGVAITFKKQGLYASIECLNTGEITGLISKRDGNPSAWLIESDTEDILRSVQTIREFFRDNTPASAA